MRGRKPHPVTISPSDRTILQQMARSQSLSWFQVRRARIVLEIAAGQRTQTVAWQMQCAEDTVRRTCRLFEREGMAGLVQRPSRLGRPAQISPPPAGPDHPTGLLGACGRGVAHHALVQC
jgi:DNA-binding CsgD family transcriptional regulator